MSVQQKFNDYADGKDVKLLKLKGFNSLLKDAGLVSSTGLDQTQVGLLFAKGDAHFKKQKKFDFKTFEWLLEHIADKLDMGQPEVVAAIMRSTKGASVSGTKSAKIGRLEEKTGVYAAGSDAGHVAVGHDLSQLADRDVKVNARGVVESTATATAVVASEINESKMGQASKSEMTQLKATFVRYCATGESSMSVAQFKKFCKDAGHVGKSGFRISDVTLCHAHCRQIGQTKLSKNDFASVRNENKDEKQKFCALEDIAVRMSGGSGDHGAILAQVISRSLNPTKGKSSKTTKAQKEGKSHAATGKKRQIKKDGVYSGVKMSTAFRNAEVKKDKIKDTFESFCFRGKVTMSAVQFGKYCKAAGVLELKDANSVHSGCIGPGKKNMTFDSFSKGKNCGLQKVANFAHANGSYPKEADVLVEVIKSFANAKNVVTGTKTKVKASLEEKTGVYKVGGGSSKDAPTGLASQLRGGSSTKSTKG